MDGQRHKKKEIQMKSGVTQPPKRSSVPGSGGISLRCELCDVTCTGNDAYAAHIRGAKHQKVVKLHTKLGKPIPSTDPVVVNPNANKNSTKIQSSPVGQIPSSAGKIKVLGTPRINFIGGGRLHTTSLGELKPDTPEAAANLIHQPMNQSLNPISESPQSQPMEIGPETQPVGQDYVDEIKSEEGKVVSFHCKLCDCRFNDPNAKEMHLKGRRHRLQYKKKVDPNLIVDVKPSLKHRKLLDVKDKRHNFKRDMHYWNDWYPQGGGRYNYDARHMPPPPFPPPPPHLMPPPPSGFGAGFMGNPMAHNYRRHMHLSSWDDVHIMQKHAEICPKEDELDEIHHLVSCTERALKLVSDKIAEDDAANAMNDMIKREFSETPAETANNETPTTLENQNDNENNEENLTKVETESKPENSQQFRLLKGLMRIGTLAKGLLLSGDREIDLVVICAEKPSKQLLERVIEYLPSQLQV